MPAVDIVKVLDAAFSLVVVVSYVHTKKKKKQLGTEQWHSGKEA